MKGIKTSEKDVQRAILDYLRITHQKFWRHNSGGFKNKDGHFFKFGESGSPDIFIVRQGKIYGVEVKGTGGKQTDNQVEWQKDFEKAGGIYLLVHSVDEFLKSYYP